MKVLKPGDRAGEWTVLASDGGRHFVCRCSCGMEKRVFKYDLLRGKSERCKNCSNRRRSLTCITHGLTRSTEYNSWQNMRQRCCNPSAPNYKDYGARGIQICERWSDFSLFLADMGRKPSTKHSIERYDTNGDYCPENCGWELPPVQARNQRSNIKVLFNGELLCLIDAAMAAGIDPALAYGRKARGWPESRWLEPVK